MGTRRWFRDARWRSLLNHRGRRARRVGHGGGPSVVEERAPGRASRNHPDARSLQSESVVGTWRWFRDARWRSLLNHRGRRARRIDHGGGPSVVEERASGRASRNHPDARSLQSGVGGGHVAVVSRRSLALAPQPPDTPRSLLNHRGRRARSSTTGVTALPPQPPESPRSPPLDWSVRLSSWRYGGSSVGFLVATAGCDEPPPIRESSGARAYDVSAAPTGRHGD